MKVAAILCPLLLVVSACAGSTPPPSDAKEAASSSSDEKQPAYKGDPNERRDWMASCAQEPGMDDYCSCAFDHIMTNTTTEDRNAAANANMKKTLSELPRQCGGKLPAPMLRASFIKGCATEPSMKPYCNCSFEYMYKHDLVTKGADAARGAEADIKKACFNELYDLSRQAFLTACEAQQTAKMCTCTFNAMERSRGKKMLLELFETNEGEAKQAARAAAIGCSAK